jgi:hypothetical protein
MANEAVDHISKVPWISRVPQFQMDSSYVWRNLSPNEDIEDRIIFCNVTPGAPNSFYFARKDSSTAVKIEFDSTVAPADLNFSMDDRWMKNPNDNETLYKFFKENEPSNFKLKKHIEELGRVLGTNMPAKLSVGRNQLSASWDAPAPFRGLCQLRIWKVSSSGKISQTFGIDFADPEVLNQIDSDPTFPARILAICGRETAPETVILSLSSDGSFVFEESSSYKYFQGNRFVGDLPGEAVLQTRLDSAGTEMQLSEKPLAENLPNLRILLPFSYQKIKPILTSLGLAQHPSIYLLPIP